MCDRNRLFKLFYILLLFIFLNIIILLFYFSNLLLYVFLFSRLGVCLIKSGISIGKANTNLMWEEGGPYLNYTDGDECKPGQRRYTIIAFICGAEGSRDGPLIMEQNTCQLIIHWNTNLVCGNRVRQLFI